MADVHHFSKAFRKTTGMTPGEWIHSSRDKKNPCPTSGEGNETL
ncbi:AraC family transcriptional regulator [Cohnella sp. 56]